MLRFTDTTKWSNPSFRKMASAEKVLFLYVWECCNNAGFIPYDDELASVYTGIAVDRVRDIWPKLKDTLLIVDGWIWVREFPRLQKNWPLNPKNGSHRQIIGLLSEQRERFIHCPEFTSFIAPVEGLLSPLGIGNSIGRGIGNGMDQGSGIYIGSDQGNGIGKSRVEESELLNIATCGG